MRLYSLYETVWPLVLEKICRLHRARPWPHLPGAILPGAGCVHILLERALLGGGTACCYFRHVHVALFWAPCLFSRFFFVGVRPCVSRLFHARIWFAHGSP